MSEWMDIETAPKDGTPFLTFSQDAAEAGITGPSGFPGSPILVMSWKPSDGEPWPVDEHGDFWDMHNYFPTHWMPLPAPPNPAD